MVSLKYRKKLRLSLVVLFSAVLGVLTCLALYAQTDFNGYKYGIGVSITRFPRPHLANHTRTTEYIFNSTYGQSDQWANKETRSIVIIVTSNPEKLDFLNLACGDHYDQSSRIESTTCTSSNYSGSLPSDALSRTDAILCMNLARLSYMGQPQPDNYYEFTTERGEFLVSNVASGKLSMNYRARYDDPEWPSIKVYTSIVPYGSCETVQDFSGTPISNAIVDSANFAYNCGGSTNRNCYSGNNINQQTQHDSQGNQPQPGNNVGNGKEGTTGASGGSKSNSATIPGQEAISLPSSTSSGLNEAQPDEVSPFYDGKEFTKSPVSPILQNVVRNKDSKVLFYALAITVIAVALLLIWYFKIFRKKKH